MLPTTSQIARECGRALFREGTPVELRWVTVEGGTTDPTTGAVIGGVETQYSGTEQAFIHFPAPATTMLHLQGGIEMGDCLLDLRPDIDLENRPGLRFVLPNGGTYVPKRLGDTPALHLDTLAGTGADRTFRTLLLRKAT